MANVQNAPLMPLTVGIIAHQADAKLQRALESVSWAAEVIVVWNGETELPASFQLLRLHVINQKETVTDYAALRNLILQKAEHEWVLFLDSDEYVQPTTKETITDLLHTDKFQAYFLKRRDIFLGKELQWGEVRNVQMVRLMKKVAAHYERPVHEVVKINGSIGRSSLVIYHSAHDSIQSFLTKIIKYIQMEAKHRPRPSNQRILLEMMLWPMGKFWWNYIMQLGFLDGWRGLIYALMMSIHSFGVRAQLYEKN